MDSRNKNISLIGVPTDSGARKRGTICAPDAIRCADLQHILKKYKYTVIDTGNILIDDPLDITLDGISKNAGEVAAWVQSTHDAGYAALKNAQIPLWLGGDHSIAMGSVSAAKRYADEQGKAFKLLWIDAHPDFNAPATSPTGNMHGMPVSALCGDKSLAPIFGDIAFTPINPKDITMFGIRSVDHAEYAALEKKTPTIIDMRKIDEEGVSYWLTEFLKDVKSENAMLHVSFDLDALDPAIAPGVGTRVDGGLTYREAQMMMELLYESGLVTSLDITEFNPLLDHEGKTGALAVDLIARLFGKQRTDSEFME